MQVQFGCTDKLNCKLWQHTPGYTLLGCHHLFVYVMQTTTVNLLFFSFLYKNVSACYIHYWKKEEMQNACLCANLKNTVDLWHIYMAYSHMAYIHMGGTTWTKGQFPRGALTSLHLS